MRFLTFLSSVALLSSTHVHAQSTKGKCELYNVLTIPATFRDVCVSGTCMKAETFIPDFDFPNDIEGKRAYQETDRVINNYHQNYCGALGSFSAGLFPQGCTSCEQKACDYVSVDGVARGQVEMTLGSDGTPVWRNSNKDTLDRKTGTGIKSITSAESFYKWYHDTPATTRFDSSIILKREKHTQTFSMQQEYFFPLDTRGWQDTQEANDRAQHNFGFTTRIFSEFVYTGGETFTFQGDDDVWVFIDNKLAIDIGGLHPAMCRTILLDEAVNGGTGKVYDCTVNPVVIKAAREGETYTIAGLTKHSQHNLTIFHAERHRDASTFAMSTSIGFNAGDTGGLDYTLPSATGARIYIGTYQFITLGSVESAPDTIYLPIYTGTPFDTPVTITLEFPPSAQTQILCRILQLSPTAIASLKLDEVDRNTITPPLDVNFVKTTANQATWASVTTEADHSATICTANPADKPSWTITVRTTGGGFGYLYCIADSSASYSDYTAEGKARDTNFYRKWVATAITSQAPTTAAPTTLPPTTVAPTTLPPTTEAPTTLPPTTPAPTTLAPTTAAPTTQAPTTEAPTTQAPTTAAPTTVAPIITTQPPTTEAPTAAPTTQTPTTLTPTTETPTTATPTTQTPTTQTPSTAAPTTPAPTTNAPTDAVTTAPPTTTSAPTSGVTTNPPTSTSTPTVTVAPTDATTSTPTNPTTSVPTSTGQPTNNPTDAPTSTPTPTLTPAPTSISITTTSPPTTPVTEAPITEAPPTDEPTEAPIGGGSGVASAVASSEMSMTTKLTIIIPAVVGGLIVVLLAVWAIHHCIKKRNNAVMHTQRTSMEMV